MMRFVKAFILGLALAGFGSTAFSQPPDDGTRSKVRTVSIPISIFTKQELKEDRLQEYIQLDRLIVRENGDEQQILSIRSIEDAPMSLAVLIQDDLTSEFNLQIEGLKKFITRLPRGSRVMVAYLRSGSTQIRQRFTDDLQKAANSLRIVVSNGSSAPRSPYDGVVDVLDRFDALPAGRRAILLVSDGLDLSAGFTGVSPSQSIELEKAVLRAQRKSVAIFSIYTPSSSTASGQSNLVLVGQGSLEKISDETGGRAFFQGTTAPISFEPFFHDLTMLLNRQFLLTYLSPNMKKGYYKVQVTSTNPEIKVEHPKGYYHR